VEVERIATRLRKHVGLVTAPIAGITDVERLMKIADQVLDPEKRLEALRNGPTVITKDSKFPAVGSYG